MRWGGVLLAIFIVFHILHFTLGAVGFSPGQFKDLQVYENVVAGFSVWPVAVFYIVAMARCVCTLTTGSGACCRRLQRGRRFFGQLPRCPGCCGRATAGRAIREWRLASTQS